MNPGSVYNALRMLTREGFLEEVGEDEHRRPARTTYRLTGDGETEYFVLLRDALWTVSSDPSRLMGGVAFMRVGEILRLADARSQGEAACAREVAERVRSGVVERMRVTPAPRAALLLGRVLRNVVVLLVQGIILVLTATLFGLRAPLGGLILGIAVVGLLGAAFSAGSYAAGLKLKSEDALAPLVNMLAVPLLLLSGILLPMTLAPAWLKTVADVNPLKHVVDGVRALFLGDVWTSTALWGLVATVGLVLSGILLGTRTFQRESA